MSSNTLKSTNSLAENLFTSTYELTNKCVQCGYCLPVCPTYESMGKETQSPRGRINLIKLASMEKIDLIEHLANPIDLCLDCRACEVACPVGVPYGQILSNTRKIIESAQLKGTKRSGFNQKIKLVILNKVFPNPKILKSIGNITWFYQKSGTYKVVRKAKLIDKVSKPLAGLEKALPMLDLPSNRLSYGIYPAKGERKGRIAFFLGCVTDAALFRTNRLSVELLNLIGFEVVIPEKQRCCGALHSHQGQQDQAIILAKQNIEAFENSGAEFFVNNAGGCGAMLSEYNLFLKDEQEWKERATEFVKKSKDISEILVQYQLPFKKEWKGIITYQDSCHLRNVQGIYKEPRKLLKSIPGATYVELEDTKCCGSGGIYNIIHFNESMKILDLKMTKLIKTKATTVVTANPGCLLQMRIGVDNHGLTGEIETLHLIDILADTCGLE